MKESLNKDFFKFLAGFVTILMMAIAGVIAVGYYEVQNANKSSSLQPPTVQGQM